MAADFGKLQVGFAGDDVIGELDDGLTVGFVADFRAAEDDDELGANAFEGGNEFGGGGDVPDVNAEADDLRRFGEEGFGDFDGALVNVELEQFGARAEVAEIGEQVTQAESGVDIFCV